jgi:CRISPR-associated endonuclease/helicase Cas3
MNPINFDTAFTALTGNPPFPWQRDLYESWFAKGEFPDACTLPTGLGKTSVIAVWLIALANHPDRMPRRLVYVVNRRTVVDQTTDEVVKYRQPLEDNGPPWHPVLLDMSGRLRALSTDPTTVPLAISTLRGQFADNREWSADPSRPAIICGTVDMIGSRLLFSGYGIGRGKRPLHAGFLGQDALLIHDEAHLEPAFQELVLAIQKEQVRERASQPAAAWPRLRVMELTATPRSGEGEVFELTPQEKQAPAELPEEPTEPIHHVWRRTHAKKALQLAGVADEKRELVLKIVQFALEYQKDETKPAVLVFVRTVKAVNEIVTGLKKGKVDEDNILTLTGTMRGYERDRMATESRVFARFKKGSPAEVQPGTVYLVCTSAGEVGVDISADHLVCDLSTLDSMAQRFGRVNRYGAGDARIDLVYPKTLDAKGNLFDAARERTLGLLKRLRTRPDGKLDAGPAALGELIESAIREGSGGSPLASDRTEALRKYILSAFAPPPTILPTSDILFDSWALTTIKEKLPGRPPVEPYLHGVTDDGYDTEFAWREEVELLNGKVPDDTIAELLDAAPLKPHETLRVPTFDKMNGAYYHLEAIREREPKTPAWVIEPNGDVRAYPTLAELLKTTGKGEYAVSLAERTVVLPPKAGGLTVTGTLQGSEPHAEEWKYDVAGTPPPKVAPLIRLLVTPGEEKTAITAVSPVEVEWWPSNPTITRAGRTFRVSGQRPLRVAFALDIPDPDDEDAPSRQYVIVRPIRTTDGKEVVPEWPALDGHLSGVAGFAKEIVSRLELEPKLAAAVIHAAEWHDHGKARTVWQRGAGNSRYGPVAKTLHGRAPENLNHYRHELGSMVDVSTRPDLADDFDRLDADHQDVVLHLIATHHGRGRPHFPANERYDLERPADVVGVVAAGTPARFARLQRRFGRWGLAYLESLLRAADILESQRIESSPLPEEVEWPKAGPPQRPELRPLVRRPAPEPTITVAVDPTNPGQFFACCGLLELADRLWPGAEGWFAESGRAFQIVCEGSLKYLLAVLVMDSPSAVERLECNRLAVKPIIAPLELTFDGGSTAAFTLDAWTRIQSVKGVVQVIANTPWNFWSGQQTAYGIWSGLRTELAAQLGRLEPDQYASLFTQRLFQKGRFGFDPGPAWNALDVGFSPNEHNMEVESSPAVELLAAVGLQRFRPVMSDNRDSFDYFTWHTPYSPAVAAAAMAGAMPEACTVRYRGSVVSRGQYGALDFSYPILQGASSE